MKFAIIETPQEILCSEGTARWWQEIEAQCSEFQNVEYRKLCISRFKGSYPNPSSISIVPDKDYSVAFRKAVDLAVFFVDRSMTQGMELRLLRSLAAEQTIQFWALESGNLRSIGAELNSDSPKGFEYTLTIKRDGPFGQEKEELSYASFEEAIQASLQMKEEGRL